jgi:hypothetical protein
MTRRDMLMRGLGLGLMVGGGLLCMVTPQEVMDMASLHFVFTTPMVPTLTDQGTCDNDQTPSD